jgi:hypothetical protein
MIRKTKLACQRKNRRRTINHNIELQANYNHIDTLLTPVRTTSRVGTYNYSGTRLGTYGITSHPPRKSLGYLTILPL